MPKVDKEAKPTYEREGDKIAKYSVTKRLINLESLKKEKSWLEQRLLEVKEALGVKNG